MAFIRLKIEIVPQPAFDWQARILQIRNAGDTVGYGGTYKLNRDLNCDPWCWLRRWLSSSTWGHG